MHRTLNDQTGMTLVEILTTLAIIGIISVGVLRVYSISTSAQDIASARTELTTKADEIRSGLASRNTCTQNLRNKVFNINSTVPTTVLTGISYYSTSGTRTSEILPADPTNTGTTLVQLLPRTAVPPTEVLGDIEIISRTAAGVITSRRKVPILARMNGNLIESCITGVDTNAELKEKMCTLGGDPYSYWDENKQKCLSKRTFKTKRIYGTAFAATCDAEYPTKTGECWLDEPPGWKDTSPQLTRTYPDGTTVSAGAPAYTCWFSGPGNNTCTCFYAKDILDKAGFRAWLTCQKEIIAP